MSFACYPHLIFYGDLLFDWTGWDRDRTGQGMFGSVGQGRPSPPPPCPMCLYACLPAFSPPHTTCLPAPTPPSPAYHHLPHLPCLPARTPHCHPTHPTHHTPTRTHTHPFLPHCYPAPPACCPSTPPAPSHPHHPTCPAFCLPMCGLILPLRRALPPITTTLVLLCTCPGSCWALEREHHLRTCLQQPLNGDDVVPRRDA